MKERYSVPVLIIQSFKVNETIMASKDQCGVLRCHPNGFDPMDPSGPNSCMVNCDGTGYFQGGVDYYFNPVE